MTNKWLAGTLVAGALYGAQTLAAYPERNIQAVVPWGAGGATDGVARAITPHVEKILGSRLVLSNRPGGTGLIGTDYVLRQRADGYTMLYGAENPQLYPLLGLAEFDYRVLHPVSILGQSVVVIAVHPDSPFDSMQALLDHAGANPGQLRMGTVGVGGAPATVHSMVNSVRELKVREVTFGGDGPGITALMGNHIDFMPLSLGPTKSQIQAGRLRALAVLSDERHPELPEVPAITESIPEMRPFMPWGTFWGVFVRKDTPEAIKRTLEDAYRQAAASPEFQQALAGFGARPLNLSGEEASAYLNRWQSVTAWSIYRAGAAQRSPEELGIAEP
ncbi:tripartite tricarboxylate transporter substrate binding protein [Stutzerimonas tarimensis]|uniref:Tripartite tricarboxylate transporter substrate binding protein n=1 Tax=Stutzerimonas tarimensis TaxID=1507735 RepID=A0ABV7T4N4_9GAMM